MHRARALRVALAGALLVVLAAAPVAAATPQPYFQGFETDTFDWSAGAMRVASGTNGITSHGGNWHAQAGLAGSTFGFWGGRTDTFPVGGYTTAVWVYLDLSATIVNDTRFDFSSAINGPDGNHRRDFVFNGGFYNDSDVTGAGPRFVFTGSNNAGRANSFPKNPARDPLTITATGWYEFRHVFSDISGVLSVDLEILSSSGAVLNTWTLSDPSDLIGTTVGGNRYGWFATQEFPILAFDDARLDVRVGPPGNKDDCKDGGWQTFNFPREFENQGDCIQFVNTGK